MGIRSKLSTRNVLKTARKLNGFNALLRARKLAGKNMLFSESKLFEENESKQSKDLHHKNVLPVLERQSKL